MVESPDRIRMFNLIHRLFPKYTHFQTVAFLHLGLLLRSYPVHHSHNFPKAKPNWQLRFSHSPSDAKSWALTHFPQSPIGSRKTKDRFRIWLFLFCWPILLSRGHRAWYCWTGDGIQSETKRHPSDLSFYFYRHWRQLEQTLYRGTICLLRSFVCFVDVTFDEDYQIVKRCWCRRGSVLWSNPMHQNS